MPTEIKGKITQAVKGAEWWLPVNRSYWKEPEGTALHNLHYVLSAVWWSGVEWSEEEWSVV